MFKLKFKIFVAALWLTYIVLFFWIACLVILVGEFCEIFFLFCKALSRRVMIEQIIVAVGLLNDQRLSFKLALIYKRDNVLEIILLIQILI